MRRSVVREREIMAPTTPKLPPLGPGEPMVKLALPGPDGAPVDLQHQDLAGRTRVLWITRGEPSAERMAKLAGLTEAFDAVEARLFHVVGGKADGEEAVGIARLLDPEERLAPALNLARDGMLVLDPSWRIALLAQGDAFAEALAAAQKIHALTEPVVRRSGAPALIVPEVFEAALCERVIAYWQAGEKVVDSVSTTHQSQDLQTRKVKRRSDVTVQDKQLFEILKTRIARRLIPEIRKAFAFDVTRFEALRIGCYDAAAGGYFRRHRDNATPYTAHRSFAMSLNLNTGAYEGGQLLFPEFGRERYEPPAGGAVVFSCSMLHEALPVTAGRRFAIFTFLYDEKGAEHEQRMIEREKRAGRSGIEMR